MVYVHTRNTTTNNNSHRAHTLAATTPQPLYHCNHHITMVQAATQFDYGNRIINNNINTTSTRTARTKKQEIAPTTPVPFNRARQGELNDAGAQHNNHNTTATTQQPQHNNHNTTTTTQQPQHNNQQTQPTSTTNKHNQQTQPTNKIQSAIIRTTNIPLHHSSG